MKLEQMLCGWTGWLYVRGHIPLVLLLLAATTDFFLFLKFFECYKNHFHYYDITVWIIFFAALALLLLKEPCESLTDIVPNTGAALPDDAGNVVDGIFLFLFHKNVRTYY